MAKLEQVVTGDKLLYHDKEFRKKIKAEMPSKTSDLTNDSNYVADASYVHTDSNYTATEKTKLAGVDDGAEVNVIESVKVNGTTQTVTDKGVDITVPTKISALTNDSNFQTEDEVSQAIKDAIGTMTGVSFNVVDALPETGTAGVIYLVSHAHATGDAYDEYIYLTDKKVFEKIGNTDVDLSGYVQTSDLTEITNTQVDTIITEAFTDSTTTS